jgi:outer membrane receptor protein involved in Fe transport
LPAAPPVTLALAPRLGDEATWIRALGAVRGPVSSTLFGTLTSPGSALLDLAGRVPLGTGLGALVTVQNVLDVRDARDQNLLPLPGRLLFVSLEVRT